MSHSETSTIPMPDSTKESAPPTPTIFSRVASIPLVASLLETTNATLSENAYTRSTYDHAKALSSSVYGYSQPVQARLAPLIVRADGYANKGFDLVESRFPSAFKTKPEDVSEFYRVRRQSVTDYVRQRQESSYKAFDENLRSPAYTVVEGIDQKFAPIVNYFETKIHNDAEPAAANASSEAKYQYQKAIALSKELRDHVYVYSNEQIKEIHAHSALLQRATDTAHSLNATASSSITTAQTQISSLSDAMLSELQKAQSSAAELTASLQSTASAIPPHLQEFTTGVQATIKDLSGIMLQKDLPLQEKVNKISAEVGERVTPLLESAKKSVQDLIAKARSVATPPSTPTTNGINGHAK